MTPSPYTVSGQFALDLNRWRRFAFLLGVAFSVISIGGAFFRPSEFFHSYLFAYLFWFGLTLGSMAIVMIQYLTGGAWGVMTRRALESAMRTLPLVALLFIPILVGIPRLYDWAHADRVRQSQVLTHRAVYMNTPMFIGRAILYFAVWMVFVWLLNKWSAEEDRRGDQTLKLARLSAPGLVIYVFTVTFASIDWAESLRSDWYSTIWGFIFVVGQGLTAISFAIIAIAWLSRREPLSGAVNTSHFHDLGKLLFMFVMLWGYMAFSQLLIVWSGNLTHEISWYLPTFDTTWGWIGGFGLIVFQFLVPFLLLLSKPLKKNPVLLSSVVGILIFMRFVDLFWIVMPQYYTAGFTVHWLDFSVPLAIGAIWIADFLRQLKKQPLLPLGAPNLERALSHSHGEE
jgi:hypothetical protein